MISIFAVTFSLLVQFIFSQDCSKPTFERYFGYDLSSDLVNLIYRNVTFPSNTDTIMSCRQTCIEETKCQGFTVNFRKVSCSWYQLIPERNVKFFQTQLIHSSDGAFFKKNCFNNNVINCTYLWLFDHLPRTTIKVEEERSLGQHQVSSIEECQEFCLKERQFSCRSAVYNVENKTCHLFLNDRRTMSNALLVSNQASVYMENQCETDLFPTCEFSQERGNFALYSVYSEQSSSNINCEKSCIGNDKFICRGYYFDPKTRLCKLGTDDSFSIDVVNNSTNNDEVYYQRSDCSDVRVDCSPSKITASFRMDKQFEGKIFSVKSPTKCKFDLSRQFEFNISISLEDRELCGVESEESNTLSAMLHMQYHRAVKTSRDKTFKVVCKYQLGGQTVQSFVEVNEANKTHTNEVVTGGGTLPEANMRIVNGEGQTVTTAEVGQILYAEVILKTNNDNASNHAEYGLFVTGCEAFDEGQKVILIDQFGCPLDTALFEGFYPVAGSDNRILRAAFQGFRFQTKRRVNINCNVNFCFRFCQPNLCTDRNGRRVMSYGKRRKRKRESLAYQQIIGSTSVKSTITFDDANLLVLEDNTNRLISQLNNETVKQFKIIEASKTIDHLIITIVLAVILSFLFSVCILFVCLKLLNVHLIKKQ